MSVKEFLAPPRSYKPNVPVESPFYSAKKEWDNRIGSVVVQAKNWRYAFFILSLVSFTLLGIIIYQFQTRQVIPIIVGIDKERGEPVILGKVGEGSYQPNDLEVKYFLSNFINLVRSVPKDPVLIKQNWLKAYKFMRAEASNQLNDKTNKDEDSPLKKIGEKTIIVQPITVVRIDNSNSYQIRWSETVFNKQGLVEDKYILNGVFSIEINAPKEEELLLTNPLGIFITNFQWNKEL